MRGKSRSAHLPEPDAATAADTVLRVAVLLQAGIAPSRAWAHLAATGDAVAAAVHADVGQGASVPHAIAARGGSWREIGAAWRVAEAVGAPLAENLRGIAAALRDAQESADEIRVALAEPAGTTRLMGWLPLVAVLLGGALGFDTFLVLLRNPLGFACLIAGIALVIAARRWSGALVRSARPGPGIPGMRAELLAIGLSGGVSIDRAKRIVAESTGESGAVTYATESAESEPPPDEIDATLTLSRSAGVPAVELLRAAASLARHRARTDGRLRAARLSSRLLLPLGVCTLPAFLLLGVAPMLLSVISSTSVRL
ncbi:type II secretion system F family protein [Microbacterium rhizomatis]|uniref:Pilus assembly protein TadB n=1 Tax=Microbacterium rhizomatis TaxID=1631477 RepID=A0A5J5J2I9_9MICO|nr:type II secretion system F family protein [Microbacterium rhizomatis]KAA9107570.1 pilus assembly protein TadB [Microbacterium rhizomatis]